MVVALYKINTCKLRPIGEIPALPVVCKSALQRKRERERGEKEYAIDGA